MHGKLITSGSLQALEESFVEGVRAAKAADALSPVTVVVGSNLQHIYLRRLLARSLGAVANVRFLTLLDLAGEAFLSRQESEALKPLPEGVQQFLLETVLDRASSRREASNAAGLSRALMATLRDLREGRIAPAAFAGMSSSREWIGQLARSYGLFRERLLPFMDRTRLFEEAAQASADEIIRSLPDGPMFVYGIYDLNALQWSVVLQLARTRPMTMLVPWQRQAEVFSYADATVARLVSAEFEQIELAGGAEASPRGDRELFSCADRQSEVEEAARRVLEDIEDGVPPSGIAILHHLDQVFDETLDGVLERAQIPFYLASGRPVRRTAVGRSALILLQLIYEEPRRASLLELLSLPCTDVTWVGGSPAPRPARWEALSKEFGLVKGWEEFRNVLTLQVETADAGDPDDRRSLFKEEVSGLLQVVDALANEAERATQLGTWNEHAGFFTDLLARLAPGEQQGNAFSAIGDRLSTLALLDAAAVPVSLDRFRDAAETAIRTTVTSGGYFQRDGVFVGSMMAARLLRFQRVYLLECSERTLPPVVRQDPLLLDEERAQINQNQVEGYLPIKRERLAEERLLFELACQAGSERLTFAYSRHAPRSNTPRLPSSFVLNEAESLSGVFMSAQALERDAPSWLTRLPARIGFSGRDGDALRAIDSSDLRFHILEEGGSQALDAIRSLWPGLDRLNQQRRGRSAPGFGPFDGIVPPALIRELHVLGGDLSATALSNYATCPYRFFLANVLSLRAREEPEETLEIAPDERGNLVHRILERFVSRYLTEGGSWAGFLDERARLLDEIMEEEFAALPDGIRGLTLTWVMVKEQVGKDVQSYLDEERLRAAEGWQPQAAEVWFENVKLEAGGRSLTVRGRIDRLDRSPSGLRVVDYKTGRGGWDQGDGYRTGSSLQFPVYLHAAAQEHDVPLADVRAEFHFVSERAEFQRLALTGADLSGDDRFSEVLSAIAEGIESGIFFYNPGKERANCRICDFFDVCNIRVAEHSERKAAGSQDVMRQFQRITDDWNLR